MYYQNTQFGYTIVLLISLGIVVPYIFGRPPSFLILAVLVIVGVYFSTLTIRVNDEKVEWYFGPPILKKSILVCDIREVIIVKTNWLTGYGIRYVNEGTLYKVAGSSAVQLIAADGKKYFLGTNEPDKLRNALLNMSCGQN